MTLPEDAEARTLFIGFPEARDKSVVEGIRVDYRDQTKAKLWAVAFYSQTDWPQMLASVKEALEADGYTTQRADEPDFKAKQQKEGGVDVHAVFTKAADRSEVTLDLHRFPGNSKWPPEDAYTLSIYQQL